MLLCYVGRGSPLDPEADVSLLACKKEGIMETTTPQMWLKMVAAGCAAVRGVVEKSEVRPAGTTAAAYIRMRYRIGNVARRETLLIATNSEYVFFLTAKAKEQCYKKYSKELEAVVASVSVDDPSFWLSRLGVSVRVGLLCGLGALFVLALVKTFRRERRPRLVTRRFTGFDSYE